MHKILLIGDSCTDIYYSGTCDRLSPEAPVPIIRVTKRMEHPGMAANVFENIKAFGCAVTFYTNPEQIVKTRYIDSKSGQHLLRVDEEHLLNPSTAEFLDTINTFDAVVISDYDKGFVTEELIVTIRQMFEGPMFVDTKKRDLKKFEGCFVKINNYEHSLIKSECSSMIITLGGEGAKYNDVIYPAPKVEVYDVCGAGDTFLAAVVYKYLMTNDIARSIVYANKASSRTVQHRGTYVLTPQDLLEINDE